MKVNINKDQLWIIIADFVRENFDNGEKGNKDLAINLRNYIWNELEKLEKQKG